MAQHRSDAKHDLPIHRRRAARCVAAILIAALVLWFFGFLLREPRFQGQPASLWVAQHLTNPPPDAVSLRQALDPMPPELAVPALIKLGRQAPSQTRTLYASYYRDLPAWLRRLLPRPRIEPNWLVRTRVLLVLGLYGHEAQPAVPFLIEMAGDRSSLGSAAVTALSRIGPAASNAIPHLARLFRDRQYVHRAAVPPALAEIDAHGISIPVFTEALSNSNPQIQIAAASALYRTAFASPELIAALRHATNRPNAAVRNLAQVNLQRLLGTNALANPN